jgi:hypothetical protein
MVFKMFQAFIKSYEARLPKPEALGSPDSEQSFPKSPIAAQQKRDSASSPSFPTQHRSRNRPTTMDLHTSHPSQKKLMAPTSQGSYPGAWQLTTPSEKNNYPHIKRLLAPTQQGGYPGVQHLIAPEAKIYPTRSAMAQRRIQHILSKHSLAKQAFLMAELFRPAHTSRL